MYLNLVFYGYGNFSMSEPYCTSTLFDTTGGSVWCAYFGQPDVMTNAPVFMGFRVRPVRGFSAVYNP
jgi:hypothetical protein